MLSVIQWQYGNNEIVECGKISKVNLQNLSFSSERMLFETKMHCPSCERGVFLCLKISIFSILSIFHNLLLKNIG